MIRRPPRSTLSSSSAASDVYKRQVSTQSTGEIYGAHAGVETLVAYYCSTSMNEERQRPSGADDNVAKFSETMGTEDLSTTHSSAMISGDPKDRMNVLPLFEQLCDAVRGDDQELYSYILRKNPELINHKGQFGDTLLHWAIMSGHDKAVKKLVFEFGADVNVTSKNFADGHTPLHLAASQGSEQMLKALLDRSKTANLHARTACGETPLHKAAMAGKDLNVKRLLEMTADINAVDNYKNTALHHGAYSGDHLVVRRLMEAGAQRGLENTNKQKPEDMAKTKGIAELIDELSPDREDGFMEEPSDDLLD
eukprot:TRINITY_DN4863_c0_g1_i2.p1 TRINITY_DN4863_c0_g1~~TRINITY_DN4863_c0_g1_i2.p1  ORF type:complete len:309 (+),score=89.35 TRINITY_DN4863_c0_g1_i2:44-970(+)